MSRRGVGLQEHVGGFDAFPAGDRRAVEGVALEHILVDARHVGRDVLHLTLGVGETQVDKLYVLVLDGLQDVVDALHDCSPVVQICVGVVGVRILDGVGAGLTGADADGVLDS